jgi:O-acetylhomoserine (thiol)-lyase
MSEVYDQRVRPTTKSAPPLCALSDETICLHGAYRSDRDSKAIAVPIYQTAAYEFGTPRETADVFSCHADGNTYSRIMNPTADILEQRVAMLDGGVGALAVACGQAAITTAILNITMAGDNFVSSTDLYGGTWQLFRTTLGRLGIEVRFVNPDDPDNFRRAADARTRCFFGEVLPNPKLVPFPIEEVARIGADIGIPLIVDNTMGPSLCKPARYGAALTVYSATKYICGHGTALGGIIVDNGNFDWTAHADRFNTLAGPDSAHDHIVWTNAIGGLRSSLGHSAFTLKARMTVVRDLGGCISPFNAFLLLQGLETLPLRIQRQCDNARILAERLAEHPAVAHVTYPGLMRGKPRERVDKYFGRFGGGMLLFELKGGYAAGERFIDALQLIYHAVNIGDARTLAVHPASTTHAQVPRADRIAAGVTDGSVRLSVGLENVDDLLSDINQALDAAG